MEDRYFVPSYESPPFGGGNRKAAQQESPAHKRREVDRKN
jgi:hypothetical protein